MTSRREEPETFGFQATKALVGHLHPEEGHVSRFWWKPRPVMTAEIEILIGS